MTLPPEKKERREKRDRSPREGKKKKKAGRKGAALYLSDFIAPGRGKDSAFGLPQHTGPYIGPLRSNSEKGR